MDPFYKEIEQWVLTHKDDKQPFLVGLNAPQGAGKTTLTTHLVEQFSQQDLCAVSISVDDFYLTHAEQIELAQGHSHNPFLQQRGYPGTHDIELGEKTLSQLVKLGPGQKMKIPRYDKSAHNGQGDRFPIVHWSEVTGPVDIIFLEGWMLGFNAPLKPTSDPYLKDVDALLPKYSKWIKHLHAFIYLKAKDPNYVLKWRVEAEEKMRAQGKKGMSDEEVLAYAKKFIPAYERYQNSISKKSLNLSSYLEFTLEFNRRP